MNERAIRCCTAIVLVALAPAACDDPTVPSDPEPIPSELTLDAAAAPAVGTELFVRYYSPACDNDATQTAADAWSFPAMTGGPGCLVARVVSPGSAPTGGFVLWQMCGVPGEVGPKEDCDAGIREWNPRTGEVWTEVDANGEYTTSSHTTACAGFSFTRGYRYLYSNRNPDEKAGGAIVTSQEVNVTSDGVNC